MPFRLPVPDPITSGESRSLNDIWKTIYKKTKKHRKQISKKKGTNKVATRCRPCRKQLNLLTSFAPTWNVDRLSPQVVGSLKVSENVANLAGFSVDFPHQFYNSARGMQLFSLTLPLSFYLSFLAQPTHTLFATSCTNWTRNVTDPLASYRGQAHYTHTEPDRTNDAFWWWRWCNVRNTQTFFLLCVYTHRKLAQRA